MAAKSILRTLNTLSVELNAKHVQNSDDLACLEMPDID